MQSILDYTQLDSELHRKLQRARSDRLAQRCIELGASPAAVAAWPDFKRHNFIVENTGNPYT